MVTSSYCLLWQAFLTLILLVLLRCSVRAMLLEGGSTGGGETGGSTDGTEGGSTKLVPVKE